MQELEVVERRELLGATRCGGRRRTIPGQLRRSLQHAQVWLGLMVAVMTGCWIASAATSLAPDAGLNPSVKVAIHGMLRDQDPGTGDGG